MEWDGRDGRRGIMCDRCDVECPESPESPESSRGCGEWLFGPQNGSLWRYEHPLKYIHPCPFGGFLPQAPAAGNVSDCMSKLVVRASEISIANPKYPRVRGRRNDLGLEISSGVIYDIPDHPIKVLGLLHHLAGKGKADSDFFFFAIERIAAARGWHIHPTQGGPVTDLLPESEN